MNSAIDFDFYFQAIQALGSILACLLASAALIYSMVSYTRALKVSHYNELDKSYYRLLLLASRNPYLVKPDSITTEKEQEKYDIYALMVWNFLEAIYDKCLSDHHLRETWMPIIESEGRLHATWFRRPENRMKFKAQFSQFVDTFLASPLPAPSQARAVTVT